MGGFAWVTLATTDSYSLGALVLAHSLKKCNTIHKLAVLVTPAVMKSMRDQLESVFDVVKLVDVLDSKDEAHLALMKRPELGVTFTKIHCWRLTEFEKCVFLDADTLVVRNCDELFEREELSAAPDVSWPDCFNSGVFVFKPSIETFDKLLQFAMENGSFDGGDQGLLNQFFSDWPTKDIKKHLPFVYNLTSMAVYSYIPAFKHFGSETRIVHFIGTGKPWLQQLNPATRTITPTPGSEHLTPLLQKWWDIFCEKVHPFMNKSLENGSGISNSSVEACLHSNVLVECFEVTEKSLRLIEPDTPYKEENDYRQINLPYHPSDVVGPSGELLNVGFSLPFISHSKVILNCDEKCNEIDGDKNANVKEYEQTKETKKEIKFNSEKISTQVSYNYSYDNGGCNSIGDENNDNNNNNNINNNNNNNNNNQRENYNDNRNDNIGVNCDRKKEIDWSEKDDCSDHNNGDLKLIESNSINRDGKHEVEPLSTNSLNKFNEQNIESQMSVLVTTGKAGQIPVPGFELKDLFYFDCFYLDDACVNNYLEQNLRKYNMFECNQCFSENHLDINKNETNPRETLTTSNVIAAAESVVNDAPSIDEVKNVFDENSDRRAFFLPRFLTIPDDDERQCGNCSSTSTKSVSAVEKSSKVESKEHPCSSEDKVSSNSGKKDISSGLKKTEKIVAKCPKSKSISQLIFDANDVESMAPILNFRKAEPWQNSADNELHRKYSLPKLKPLIPKKESFHKSDPSEFPKVTFYTEFFMSSDYKDPVDLPSDKEGFVESHLKGQISSLTRSKSEVNLRSSKFGPMLFNVGEEKNFAKLDLEPRRSLKTFNDFELYDLKNCKRQMGNKPKPKPEKHHQSKNKKTKMSSEAVNLTKPNDLPQEKGEKKAASLNKHVSKDRDRFTKRNEKSSKKVKTKKIGSPSSSQSIVVSSTNFKKVNNIGEILKKLIDFSKDYLHYFGDLAEKRPSFRPGATEDSKDNKEATKGFPDSYFKIEESDNSAFLFATEPNIGSLDDLSIKPQPKSSKENFIPLRKFEKFKNYVRDRKEKVEKGLLSLKDVDHNKSLHRQTHNLNELRTFENVSSRTNECMSLEKETENFNSCREIVAYKFIFHPENKYEKRKKKIFENRDRHCEGKTVIPLPWYTHFENEAKDSSSVGMLTNGDLSNTDCSNVENVSNPKQKNSETSHRSTPSFPNNPGPSCKITDSDAGTVSTLKRNNDASPEKVSFGLLTNENGNSNDLNNFSEGTVASRLSGSEVSCEKFSKSLAVCHKPNKPANTIPVSAASSYFITADMQSLFVEHCDMKDARWDAKCQVEDDGSGIAGAIAQLSLKAGNSSDPPTNLQSSANQEYLRRQNWETGNMDYMGRDSFDNIWSKICQTLEEKARPVEPRTE